MARNVLCGPSYGFGPGPEWTRDEWLAVKPNLGLDFPNLPYYLDGDVKLTQSLAILKYLGRKHGLAPKTEEQQRRVDMVEMQAFDIIMYCVRVCYDPEYTEDKRRQFLTEVAPDKLKQFVTFLAKAGPFVAGDMVTYADFILYEALQVVRAMGPSSFKNYPELEKYCARVAALPGLREYLASPRFKAWPFWSPFAKALAVQHQPPTD
ncbi:hypothetical protein HPB47_024139 [Ixodes persulcatus]|uniref:Uncharacterized protein n=1 Tax=Ixodes persulcatus TaxID=34615 RepID=A0AC60Q5N2_IXOPE|nr:hypothetical protein HPB47_024139 [Ixodes persulcatus]